MRIVIDLQGAQSESRYRGIGRYSLSLAKAMAKNADGHQVWIVLNAAFPETAIDLRRQFQDLIPENRIRVFETITQVAESDPASFWRARTSERIREQFLADLKPDWVHVSSLFEGFVDNAVTSVGELLHATRTAVTLYDLIPLVDQDRYLTNQVQRNHYFRKALSLKRADLLLAISDASRNEALRILGFPPEQVVNISGAVDERFSPVSLTEKVVEEAKLAYRLERSMILYAPGGFDVRKNFERLIAAFAKLPPKIRSAHQLVIAGKVSDSDRQTMANVARRAGLARDELVLTGYVPDEDLLTLYNMARLFVFPSWHEGFGLPALEAMACGTATIASNATSLPEVIGWEDALFDPYSEQSIADKMFQSLSDEEFHGALRKHALEQATKFSWNVSARRALDAMERAYGSPAKGRLFTRTVGRRPRLAYFSPMPPDRSGIADYSADLLPELACWYDIEVIASRSDVENPWIVANFPIRSVQWFRTHSARFDRLLYHLGNSPLHTHMYKLMGEYPGVTVLHDFYLGHVLAHAQETDGRPRLWESELFNSHGYAALRLLSSALEIDKVISSYPSNLSVLQNSIGVIVHSEYSRCLAKNWYGAGASDHWAVIPLLRAPLLPARHAREQMGNSLPQDSFIVCSFGMLAPTKLSHRILDAWLESTLANDRRCHLVFVGENHGGEYGADLVKQISDSGCSERIRITGWVSSDVFRSYLAAADLAVQLRTSSRGETSAAALDCLAYGVPTIVNANGSFAELPDEVVLKLPDEFSEGQLRDALEALCSNKVRRESLGQAGQRLVQTRHNPQVCARLYAEAIERSYGQPLSGRTALITAVGDLPTNGSANLERTAEAITRTFPPVPRQRQLLIDVSNVARGDLRTGIERVVRAQVTELVGNPPSSFRVEPVYLTRVGDLWRYRYARAYTCQLLGIQHFDLKDDLVEINQGDIFFNADFYRDGTLAAAKAGLYRSWQMLGVHTAFAVFDLLPVRNPHFFPNGFDAAHHAWLRAIVQSADCLVCISNSVREDMKEWLEQNPPAVPPRLEVVHLGADPLSSAPSRGLPEGAEETLRRIGGRPSFLLVATIEPRKGLLQVLDAFDLLRRRGKDFCLVLVGQEGWKSLPDDQRQTIPEIVRRLRNHEQLERRLFWLEGISDEYLERVYAASTCLLFPSEGEGFGLPLVEAAKHKIPIIARDLPVFREVAGNNAYYFSGLGGDNLAEAILQWSRDFEKGIHPRSENMKWLTWKESAERLRQVLLAQPGGIAIADS